MTNDIQQAERTGERSEEPVFRRFKVGVALYAIMLVIFWFIARFFHLNALSEHPVSTFLGFALLFAPYWLFGFELAPLLRRRLRSSASQIASGALLATPYF